MRKSRSLEEIVAALEPVIEAKGYYLVDAVWGSAYKRRTFTIFVDKPGGVQLDECQSLSRELGDLLEEEDLVRGSYVLEVSSPGAERQLKKRRDFEYFQGRYALILMQEPLPDFKGVEVYGYLRGLAGDDVLCEVEDGTLLHIPMTKIAKARLAIKF